MSEPLRSRYPGTSPFDDSPEDVSRFFGRDEEAEQLYLRVLSVPLLVQFGMSGLGKTSLLHAGLFPRLRQKPFLPVMVRLNTAEDSLIESVVRSVQKSCEIEGLKFTPGDTTGLWEFLSTTTIFRDDLLLTPVLVFDQFEEVFTLRDAAFRAEVAAELGAIAAGIPPARIAAQKPRRQNVKIVISLREDYVGSLEEFSAAIPGLFQERLRLEPFSERAARDAVTRPAQLDGEFDSPKFELEPAALDALIQYLRGRSGVIEPIQLQLLARHAESLAHVDGVRPHLRLEDFRGSRSFGAVLENFYRDTLGKISPHSQRVHAARLCEEGLLGSDGHRLMLEERQILHDFDVRPETLNVLTQEKLIRREQRMESVFYEISHDRLAESIFKVRRPRLPKNVKQALWIAGIAAAVVIALLILFNVRVARERNKVQRERDKAQDLIGFLIGEQFLGEVRDMGSSTLLQQVQDQLDRNDPTGEKPPLLRGLSLRGRGDVMRLQGKVAEAEKFYRNALLAFEDAPDDADSQREVARAHQRLADVLDLRRKLGDAMSSSQQASDVWRRVVAANPHPESRADDCISLAESLVTTGTLKDRLGGGHLALKDADAAVDIVSNVLFGPENANEPCRPVPKKAEPYPDPEALQVLSKAALLHAIVQSTPEDYEGAATLAREARALRPSSTSARKYSLEALSWRAYAAGPEDAQRTYDDYRNIQREAEEMRRWDPGNRLWQRERAITLQMVGRGIGFCHKYGGCTPMPALEEGEAVILEAIATLRALAQLDPDNDSLQADIFWALLEQSDVLALEPQRAAERLEVLEHAEDIHGKLEPDAERMAMLAYLRTGQAQTLQALGRNDEATQALGQALATWKKLTEDHPQHPLYAVELRRLSGDPTPVEGVEDRTLEDVSVAAARTAIRRWPGDANGYRRLGDAYRDLADAENDVEKKGAFLNAALQSAQISAWLAPKADRRYANETVVFARRDIAIYLIDQDRREEALAMTVEAVAVTEALLREAPEDPIYQTNLGVMKCMVGRLRRELKQDGWEEAVRGGILHLQKGGMLGRDISWNTLGGWQWYLGRELIADGREKEGRAQFAQALASYRKAPDTDERRAAIQQLTEATN